MCLQMEWLVLHAPDGCSTVLANNLTPMRACEQGPLKRTFTIAVLQRGMSKTIQDLCLHPRSCRHVRVPPGGGGGVGDPRGHSGVSAHILSLGRGPWMSNMATGSIECWCILCVDGLRPQQSHRQTIHRMSSYFCVTASRAMCSAIWAARNSGDNMFNSIMACSSDVSTSPQCLLGCCCRKYA